MPNFTITLIAATIATLSVTPAAAARAGAFGDIVAGYSPTTGQYCIKSGWGAVTSHSGRLTRAGDCRTAAEWRDRGIAFEAVTVAKRPNAVPERLASR